MTGTTSTDLDRRLRDRVSAYSHITAPNVSAIVNAVLDPASARRCNQVDLRHWVCAQLRDLQAAALPVSHGARCCCCTGSRCVMPEETRAESPLDGTEEEGCGYSWDHTIIDLGGGQWQCTECGAEGWDEDGGEQ